MPLDINKDGLYFKEKLIYNVTEDLLILMKDKGISKKKLAQKIGKTYQYITQILSGQRSISLEVLSGICYVLEAEPIFSLKQP